MKLLDWLRGRGSNPLAVAEEASTRTRVASTPHVRLPERPSGSDDDGLADVGDQQVRQQALALGVSVEALLTMLEQRELFVAKVESEPRAWGFDLTPADAPRRDAAEEYRRATRLAGVLGESFLSVYEPLMAAAPNPLTMPDGTRLDEYLERTTGLGVDAARDIAVHIRSTIQATLGKPLEQDAVEHAVREASWDHEFDAAVVMPSVLHAMSDIL